MYGGDYTLHSHRAGVILPSDTKKFDVPNSCQMVGVMQIKVLIG